MFKKVFLITTLALSCVAQNSCTTELAKKLMLAIENNDQKTVANPQLPSYNYQDYKSFFTYKNQKGENLLTVAANNNNCPSKLFICLVGLAGKIQTLKQETLKS